MTARLSPQVIALLRNLGIAHAGNPDPVPRETAPGGSWPVHAPDAPVAVLLRVDHVEPLALEGAGLFQIEGTQPVLTGVVLPRQIPALAELDGVTTIDLPRTRRLRLHESVPATHADQVRTGALGLDGTGVVVGIVDTGIDIYHKSFRNPDGTTRLLGLLDTTAPYAITPGGGPNAGTFTLGFTPPATGGAAPAQQTTTALPFDADASAVRAALEALAAFDPGDVAVTGGPLPGAVIVVGFQGQYLNQDVNPLVVVDSHVTPLPATMMIQRGREYTPAEINYALQHPGAPFGSWDAVGHGSHCMGISAGNGDQPGGTPASGSCHLAGYYVGVAPKAQLIAVKSTLNTVENLRGINYIFTTATPAKAAVVNLSYGGTAGPHDGSDDEASAIDLLLTNSPTSRAIVVAAGNEGALFDVTQPGRQHAHGGGLHGLVSLGANAHTTMTFVISPQDTHDDEFDIWYSGTGRVSFQLAEPGGASLTGAVAPGDPHYTTTLAGNGIQIISTTNNAPSGRHNISLIISPPAGGTITQGSWLMTFTETAGSPTDVDCWITHEADDPHPRFSNADQDRTRTLGSPGTAKHVITVANYDHRDNTLANSSSRGPTIDSRPAGETKPDISAPGTGITSVRSGERNTGVCCDCCADFYVAMSGTSMATPHVTGIVALLFQRNRTLSWGDVRTLLRNNADPPDPITGPTLPNSDWGAGVVNALKVANATTAVAATTDGPSLVPTAPVPLLVAAPQVPALVPGIAAIADRGPGATRLAELRRAAAASPAGQLTAALVSTHAAEVIRLINHDRRVTVAWHRMHGPALVEQVIAPHDGPMALPAEIHGVDLATGMARLLDALERAGSERLRASILGHRQLLLSLPGRTVDDLDQLPWTG
jgi:subtilisin family serine protease